LIRIKSNHLWAIDRELRESKSATFEVELYPAVRLTIADGGQK
jgi:hypothetical protein